MVDDHGPDEVDGHHDAPAAAAAEISAEPTSRLLVVRHRQSTWNAQRRFTGRADPPLSAEGFEQAELLARRLAPMAFDAVVSSTLTRAHQTAEVIAARTGATVVTDERLVEHDVPAWQGLTREEIDAASAGAWGRWKDEGVIDAPGTEPWTAVEQRVAAALADHAGRAARVLVVAHAGVLRALATGTVGPPLKVGRAKGRWVHLVDGRLVDGGIERFDRD